MIVDTHAHYLPQELLEDLNNRSTDFPSIECLNEDNTWNLGFAGRQCDIDGWRLYSSS